MAVNRLPRGLVMRRPDRNDRRKVLVEATSKTRALIRDTYAPTARAGAELLASYSVDELQVIRRFLEDALVPAGRVHDRCLAPASGESLRRLP